MCVDNLILLSGFLKPNFDFILGITLPIKDIVKAINDAGVPAAVSLSAGAFLCNHVFYVAQDHFKDTKVRSGFVHVPLMDEQAGEFPGLPTMPLDQMVIAVRAMLEVL